MKNMIEIQGHKAVIDYDPELELFRGEFVGLSGGADFYAADITGLKTEGAKSLEVYLAECEANQIDPFRVFSGKFNVRLDPELHRAATEAAHAEGVSLNRLVEKAISDYSA